MSSDFPKTFAVAALIVVLLAVAVFGIIVGYNLKPPTTAGGSSTRQNRRHHIGGSK